MPAGYEAVSLIEALNGPVTTPTPQNTLRPPAGQKNSKFLLKKMCVSRVFAPHKTTTVCFLNSFICHLQMLDLPVRMLQVCPHHQKTAQYSANENRRGLVFLLFTKHILVCVSFDVLWPKGQHDDHVVFKLLVELMNKRCVFQGCKHK